jgi:hypothetical protein
MLINILIIFLLYLILKNIFVKDNKELFVNIKKDKLYQEKLLKDIIDHRKTMEKEYKLKLLGFDEKKSLKELNLDHEKLDKLYRNKLKESGNNIKVDLDKLELDKYYKLKLKSSGRKLDFYDINSYCYYDTLNNYKCNKSDEKDTENKTKLKLIGLNPNTNLADYKLNQVKLDKLYENKLENIILSKMIGDNKMNNNKYKKVNKLDFSNNDSNCYYDTLGNLICNKIKEIDEEKNNNIIREDDTITIDNQFKKEEDGDISKVRLYLDNNKTIYYKIEGGDIESFTKNKTVCIIRAGYNKEKLDDIIISVHPENNNITTALEYDNEDSYIANNNEKIMDNNIRHYFTFYDNGYVIYNKKIMYDNMYFDIDTKIAKYYEVTDIRGTDKNKNTRYMKNGFKFLGYF